MTISQPQSTPPRTRQPSSAQQTAIMHAVEAHAATLGQLRTQAQPQAQARAVANGAAAAAMLAAGVGSLIFGLLVILSEANATIHDLMALDASVGPLSGKSTYGMLAWLAVWGVLHLGLRKREVRLSRVAIISGVLVALAILATFPPFYMLFAAE